MVYNFTSNPISTILQTPICIALAYAKCFTMYESYKKGWKDRISFLALRSGIALSIDRLCEVEGGRTSPFCPCLRDLALSIGHLRRTGGQV